MVSLIWTEVRKPSLSTSRTIKMGEEYGPGKSDRIAIIEALKEKKGIMVIGLQKKNQ